MSKLTQNSIFEYFDDEEADDQSKSGPAAPRTPEKKECSADEKDIVELKGGMSSAEKAFMRRKLRPMKPEKNQDGFCSFTSQADLDMMDSLEEEPEKEVKHAISHTQQEREEQLDEIDAAMEDLIEDFEVSEEGSNQVAPKVEVELPPIP